MTLAGRRILTAFAWAVVLAALAILWIAPTPQPPLVTTNLRDPAWSVPRLPPKVDVSPAIAALAKGNLWGGQSASSSDTDPKLLQWRMSAIVGAGRDRVVLVQFGDERLLPIKVGDKFPDGTLVSEIRETGACVMIEGKKRFLPMPGQAAAIVW